MRSAFLSSGLPSVSNLGMLVKAGSLVRAIRWRKYIDFSNLELEQ